MLCLDNASVTDSIVALDCGGCGNAAISLPAIMSTNLLAASAPLSKFTTNVSLKGFPSLLSEISKA